ncbi:serine/threonine protein kinase [bacterium]|nr:serine/threonine protein kinase [bacterium]
MAAGLKIGDILNNRYPIVGILGEGGMGAVYEAGDLSSKRHWAVKEMTDNFEDPAERALALESFKAEADILCELEHPNLPRITHCFEENGRQYIVMDLVKGVTAEKLLREKGVLSFEETLEIAGQLIEVLDYLHGLNPPVIFRDMKPANVMVMPNKQVKLVDFGIARFFSREKSADTHAFGTPGFAAPEQYGRGQSDARTDIYALGATLHTCLTGADPSITPFKFAKVSELKKGLPEGLDAVIAKALEIDPAKRWQNVREFGKALFSLQASGGADGMKAEVSFSEQPTAALERKGVYHSAAPPAADKGSAPAKSEQNNAPAAPTGKIYKSRTGKTLGGLWKQSTVVVQELQYFNYPFIDFGSCEADKAYETSIILRGQVKGKIVAEPDWLSCDPEEIDGENVRVKVTADAMNVPQSGLNNGKLSFKDESIEVKINAKAPNTGCSFVFLRALLVVLAFLPIGGIFPCSYFFLNALLGHKFNRSKNWVYFFVAFGFFLISHIIYTIIFGVYYKWGY